MVFSGDKMPHPPMDAADRLIAFELSRLAAAELRDRMGRDS